MAKKYTSKYFNDRAAWCAVYNRVKAKYPRKSVADWQRITYYVLHKG